jgi:serine/threonine-protein kinase MDS1/RIM11
MDYFQSNLYESVQRYRGKTEIPRLKIKVYAFQLFRSLLYLNKISIAHRDIKPQNILVNDNNWNLIMCDFGSAKQLKIG